MSEVVTPGGIVSRLASRSFEPSATSSAFHAQWKNPRDVFSVLLIVGGDIIRQALAQLAGSKITPIAFSFGWVAYGVSAISSAIGENKLMPRADCSCKVINGKSGYARDNAAWIIGRIVRDFEQWMDDGKADGPIHRHVEQMLNQSWEFEKRKAKEAREQGDTDVWDPPKPIQAGLCVSVYRAKDPQIGTPGYDSLYFLGFATMFLQLGIAAIPCGLYGDWGQLLITAAGILLALASGGLGQWKGEKWTARTKSKQSFILTRGNGAQHAIVVLGDGKGLDLEDLSAVPTNVDVWTGLFTQIATVVLGLLWICLLISAAGLGDNTWYLLAIGGIGIVENIYVAGKWRKPDAFGIPLEFVEVLGQPKVMNTLFEVENRYPHVGRAMRDTFFPGELFPEEAEKWDQLKANVKERENAWKSEQLKRAELSGEDSV